MCLWWKDFGGFAFVLMSWVLSVVDVIRVRNDARDKSPVEQVQSLEEHGRRKKHMQGR